MTHDQHALALQTFAGWIIMMCMVFITIVVLFFFFCMLEFGFGPLNISAIPNKSRRPMWARESGGRVQTFNPTLLGEVEEVL